MWVTMLLLTPKLETIEPFRASGRMGEISLSRGLSFSFFVTQNFARVPRLYRRTDFTRFAEYNVNSGLLHPSRDKNAENVSIINTQNTFIWFKNCENRAFCFFCLRHKIGCHGAIGCPLRKKNEKKVQIRKFYQKRFRTVKLLRKSG